MQSIGYLPDPYDTRDEPFALGNVLDSLDVPQELSMRSLVESILDQSITNTCVGQSYAQAWHMLERGNRITDSELSSILMHYYNSRAQHGAELVDGGTFIRLCIKQANKLGRAPESAWPFDPGKVNEQPPLDAYRLAHDNRAASYHRITEHGSGRCNALRLALAANMPVIFGTQVAQEFKAYRGGDAINVPSNVPILGGHAMVAIGYSPGGVEIVNSWGTGWGDRGFGRIMWEYIEWNATRDMWALNMAA